jgi:hypothetical protein
VTNWEYGIQIDKVRHSHFTMDAMRDWKNRGHDINTRLGPCCKRREAHQNSQLQEEHWVHWWFDLARVWCYVGRLVQYVRFPEGIPAEYANVIH